MRRWPVVLLALALAGGAAVLLFRAPAVAPTVNTNGGANANHGANTNAAVPATSFTECVTAGYPVQESYPRRCAVPGGATYTEDIGNALELQDRIVADSPRPNTAVTSPLTVTGNAVGGWYSEGVFPVELLGSDGARLATGQARATGDWMTPEFVPFEATLTWSGPTDGSGTLVLRRDNPSGLPENDAALRVPVAL